MNIWNLDYDKNPKKTTKNVVKDADALITRTRTICNQDLLEDSNVKFIATATIGFDHIDTDYCKINGIHWFNVPGCNSNSVRQYIASSLLYLEKKYDFSLKEKTIGVIGIGNVGPDEPHGFLDQGIQMRIGEAGAGKGEKTQAEAKAQCLAGLGLVYQGGIVQLELFQRIAEFLEYYGVAKDRLSYLGFGFRCGFLGLLHMEIIQQRLERESDIDLVQTAPNVTYQIVTKRGRTREIHRPQEVPDAGDYDAAAAAVSATSAGVSASRSRISMRTETWRSS